MNPDEFINRLDAFRADLNNGLLPFMAQQAMNAKGVIQMRIQEDGNNSKGQTLGNYISESYIKKRENKGRQTLYVDLTMTRGGAGMFGSTGLVAQEFSGGVAKVSVAGRDEFTQDKLNWNSERYGDILGLSKSEQEAIYNAFEEFLDEKLTENGLN